MILRRDNKAAKILILLEDNDTDSQRGRELFSEETIKLQRS
jgi:hypothetical protein